MLVVGRGLVAVALADGEETGGGDAAGVLVRRALRGEEVAGDLLADEFVERLVGVEGVDDPVAILHGLANGVVRAVTGGVGVTGNVEPVATPALAVSGGSEEAVDGIGNCRLPIADWGVGALESFDFLGCRREAGEVEGHAADEGTRVGGGIGRKALLVEAGEDEAVEGLLAPGVGLGGGWLWVGEELEGPVFSHRGGVHAGGDGGGAFAGVGGAELHPLFERGDFLGAECALGGHLQVLVLPPHGLDEATLLRVAGDDDGAVVAALLPAGLGVEAEAAFLLLLAVAFLAVLDEERANLRLEESWSVRAGSLDCYEATEQHG